MSVADGVVADISIHCKTSVQLLVECVQAGALLFFDQGYFSFAFFDQLSSRGIWWIRAEESWPRQTQSWYTPSVGGGAHMI